MERRTFIKTAVAATCAAALPLSAEAAPEKPIGSPLGLKKFWRLEGKKWVRRRLKDFRIGDKLIVSQGGDRWRANTMDDGAFAWMATINRGALLKDCGDYLDYEVRITVDKQFTPSEWAAFKKEHLEE